MVGLKIGIGIFVLIWLWIFYELYKSPLIKEDKKETKTDNLLEFDEDEEFLG
jgi:hypothetical protein